MAMSALPFQRSCLQLLGKEPLGQRFLGGLIVLQALQLIPSGSNHPEFKGVIGKKLLTQ